MSDLPDFESEVFDCPGCGAVCHESWDECGACETPLRGGSMSREHDETHHDSTGYDIQFSDRDARETLAGSLPDADGASLGASTGGRVVFHVLLWLLAVLSFLLGGLVL